MGKGGIVSTNSNGLHTRYRVERLDDSLHKHDDCRYFVLDPQHDALAEQALRFYADLARVAGLTELRDDLLDWIGPCPWHGKQPHSPHEWTDIGISGETVVYCAGVQAIDAASKPTSDLQVRDDAATPVRAAEATAKSLPSDSFAVDTEASS
jgi:hypothetical protein